MKFLLDIPDTLADDSYWEIASIIRVIQEQKPKSMKFINPALTCDHEVIKRENGAIDYTIKVATK